jgi:UDP-glucose 4-epimerase
VLAHAAAKAELSGIYNAAGDGVLVLSEIASLLGRPLLPVLPPWGTTVAAAALRPLGLRMPAEMLRQLRYGRGLDNRRLKATGFSYAYTTREAVVRLRAEQRARPLLTSGDEPLIELIRSLEPDALQLLRAHEREHQRRARVLEALEDALARKAPPA